MADTILVDWTAENSRSLGSDVLYTRHSLADAGLGDDESLLRCIEVHPKHASHVYVMGRDKENYSEWQRAVQPDLSGEELLDTIRRGLIWLNLVNLEEYQPEWRERVDAMYDELEARSPGFVALDRTANLIISSPNSMVHYHADAECNLLWHLRGRKQVWAYPRTEQFIPDEELEMIFAREKEEDLPYRAELDEGAQHFVMEPGDMLTWPQNSPHRVENIEGLNVSLSTMHYTPEARDRQVVYLANRYLRGVTPFEFRSTETTGLIAKAKVFVFRVLRKLGLVPEPTYKMPETAQIDPASPTGYVQVEDAG